MKYRILKLLQYFQKINVLLIKYKMFKGGFFFFISNLTQNRVLELNNGPFVHIRYFVLIPVDTLRLHAICMISR